MDVSYLLEKAIELAEAGDKTAALPILAKVVTDDPQNEEAWLWLIDSLPSDTERVWALEECLRILPESEAAQKAYEKLMGVWQPSEPSQGAKSSPRGEKSAKLRRRGSIEERLREDTEEDIWSEAERKMFRSLRSSADTEEPALGISTVTAPKRSGKVNKFILVGIVALAGGIVIFGGGIARLWKDNQRGGGESDAAQIAKVSGEIAATFPATITSTFTATITATPTQPTQTLTPPATGTPIPPITILADARWVDTGVQVQAGQVVVIEAGGSWYHTSGSERYGPEGQEDTFYGDAYLPGVRVGTLIARVGENEPFVVGRAVEVVVEYSGMLYLTINDASGGYRENQGAAVADIQVLEQAP